jgi:hypothetical protein
MAVEVTETCDGKVISLRLSERLHTADYAAIVPEIERQIARHGKVRMLLEMHNFRGWTAGALWEDAKFDIKHSPHVERLAMVGAKSWLKGVTKFCEPFTTAEIRFFEPHEREEARRWIESGLGPVAGEPLIAG